MELTEKQLKKLVKEGTLCCITAYDQEKGCSVKHYIPNPMLSKSYPEMINLLEKLNGTDLKLYIYLVSACDPKTNRIFINSIECGCINKAIGLSAQSTRNSLPVLIENKLIKRIGRGMYEIKKLISIKK